MWNLTSPSRDQTCTCCIRSTKSSFFLLNNNNIYLAVQGLSCSMWDLVPWPGIKPRSLALGAHCLSHWTTREVPEGQSLIHRTSQEVPRSVVFSIKYIHSIVWSSPLSRTFPSAQKETPYTLAFTPHLPPPSPWQPLIYILFLWICLFWTFRWNGLVHHVILTTFLLSMFSSSSSFSQFNWWFVLPLTTGHINH